MIMRFLLIILIAMAPAVWAADESLKEIEEAQGVIDIHPCLDERLGVELLCNRQWKQEVEPHAVMMVISPNPAVLLTVARAEEPVTGIEELTVERLKALGQYAEEGFKAEKVTVNGNQAIRVEGFAKDYPELRLLDFYVIHDYTLYSFLFSVNPKEEWDNYSVLFGKIAQSIKIPDRKL
jgi:hypothetical protein